MTCSMEHENANNFDQRVKPTRQGCRLEVLARGGIHQRTSRHTASAFFTKAEDMHPLVVDQDMGG